jgi:NAD(P)-dependent dehydrogenase (short-subunit alcohol dehydrogenase family)
MQMPTENWQEIAVLVTGGSSGVGKATARKFISEGARVMVTARNIQKLRDAVEEFSNLPGEVTSMAGDVCRVGDCEAVIAGAVNRFGRLDVLVNCAGIWVEGDSSESTEEEWDQVIDTNLKGTFFMCSRAIPPLRKTQGCIINVSSDAGIMGLKNAAIYSASKGGVNLLTKSLAIELAADLVRVNAVCPADILTEMVWKSMEMYGGDDPDAYFKRLLSQYPQGDKARLIDPEEVAELIFFLASDRAQAITGALLSMDFGLTAGY